MNQLVLDVAFPFSFQELFAEQWSRGLAPQNCNQLLIGCLAHLLAPLLEEEI